LITDQQVEDAVWWLKDQSAAMAKARAERLYLESFMKSKQSLLRQRSGETSEHKRTDYALTHQEYIDLLEGYRAAVEIDEKMRFQRDANNKLIDAWQTMSSNKRSGL
jgi:hypothetical protein